MININCVGEIIFNGVVVEVGLKENDKVVSVDGKEIYIWNDLIIVIMKNLGKILDFEIEWEGKM